jgi:hypothetical protein
MAVFWLNLDMSGQDGEFVRLPNTTENSQLRNSYVLSPGNTRREIAMKRREYFRGGALLVWIIDPIARTVAVYTDARTVTTLTVADTLTGGTVNPGWTLSLGDFFGRPELNG